MFQTYSLAVIAGLEILGTDASVVRERLAIAPQRFSRILKGRLEFTDRELVKIADISGKTAGQLAAMSTEPNGGPLTELAQLGARVHKAAEAAIKAERRPAKRAAKPRRATQRHLV